MAKKDYPNWVCGSCGRKASDKQFLISTWHKGICDVCGKEKSVTEPRDFYYPHFEQMRVIDTDSNEPVVERRSMVVVVSCARKGNLKCGKCRYRTECLVKECE